MTRIYTAAEDGWPTVVGQVLTRDRACVFATAHNLPLWLLDVDRSGIPGHVCKGRDGLEIDYTRFGIGILHGLGAVELDHVKDEPSIGDPIVKRVDRHSYKAPDDTAHLVVVCHGAHHGGLATSHRGREWERSWLAARYPEVWSSWIDRNR